MVPLQGANPPSELTRLNALTKMQKFPWLAVRISKILEAKRKGRKAIWARKDV